MKVKIHSIHFDADEKLESFIGKRLDKLDQYFDNIIEGEVFLKLDNADNNENKITEIKKLMDIIINIFYSYIEIKIID